MLFVIYVFSHLIITFVRAYLRGERLKYVYPYQFDNGFLNFRTGIERRVFKVSTFLISLLVAFTLYFIYLRIQEI